MSFEICGSCYVYVEGTDNGICPQCGESMHPSPSVRLSRFIENGNNPYYRGVPLPQAQAAARTILDSYHLMHELLSRVADDTGSEYHAAAQEVLARCRDAS